MEVDLHIVDQIIDNIKNIRQNLPKDVLLSMVLKNYFITRSLHYTDIGMLVDKNTNDIDVYCIIDILDGIKLRKHNITKPLVLLYWHPADKADIMHYHNIQPAALNIEWVQTAEQVLKKANVSHPLLVHIWIDVGMGREGVPPGDVLSLAREIQKSTYLKIHGIGAHFPEHMISNKSCTKWIKHGSYTQYQNIFEFAIDSLKNENLLPEDVIIHAATSNMIYSENKELFYNMARIGTLIYYGNQPFRTFKQKILQIKEISIFSYNHHHLNHPKKVAMIELSGNRSKIMEFWINQIQIYEIQAGLLDITNIPCKIGDEITINIKYHL